MVKLFSLFSYKGIKDGRNACHTFHSIIIFPKFNNCLASHNLETSQENFFPDLFQTLNVSSQEGFRWANRCVMAKNNIAAALCATYLNNIYRLEKCRRDLY